MKRILIPTFILTIIFTHCISCVYEHDEGSFSIPDAHRDFLMNMPDTQIFVSDDSTLYRFVLHDTASRFEPKSELLPSQRVSWEFEYLTYRYVCDRLILDYSITWYGHPEYSMSPLYIFKLNYLYYDTLPEFKYYVGEYIDSMAFFGASSMECNKSNGKLLFNTSEGVLYCNQPGIPKLFRTGLDSTHIGQFYYVD